MSIYRIVVVDDDPRSRRLLRELLARESDLEVVGECRDVERVIRFIEARWPDMVLIGPHMPGIAGTAIAATLRRHYPWIRIVLMAALGGYEELLASASGGLAVVLPVAADEAAIVAAVRAVLTEPDRPRQWPTGPEIADAGPETGSR